MVQLSNDGSAVRAERSRRRAEAQRLNILRAAARVFRQRGFAGAGMREIAREADLSPGNLYHYFRGKHEILFFCQDRWLDHSTDSTTAAQQLCAPTHRLLDRPLDAFRVIFADDGADKRLFIARVAHLERRRHRNQLLPEHAVDRFVDDHALHPDAALSGLIERSEYDAGDGVLVTSFLDR